MQGEPGPLWIIREQRQRDNVMNKRHALLAAVAVVGALALTGCTSEGDPEALVTRCEGPDKVFIIDSSENGTAMFVLANHAECAK